MQTLEQNHKVNNSIRNLNHFINESNSAACFATSMSIEDQIITHFIVEQNLPVDIFTIDTGRLPEDTYRLIEKTNTYFNIKIKVLFPNKTEVESLITSHGVNLFYESIEKRKACCEVRKIIPLREFLSDFEIWISGQRQEQSITRSSIQFQEEDKTFGLTKINPLFDWKEEEVWDYIKDNNIPYNTLYKKGFTSIGCEPCTRVPENPRDTRSGRWWWEQPSTKECGLHKNIG